MKARTAFVANSSSSSFLVVTAGSINIVDDSGSREYCEEDYCSVNIDVVIAKLQEAKAAGATTVDFEYGGGYNG